MTEQVLVGNAQSDSIAAIVESNRRRKVDLTRANEGPALDERIAVVSIIQRPLRRRRYGGRSRYAGPTRLEIQIHPATWYRVQLLTAARIRPIETTPCIGSRAIVIDKERTQATSVELYRP